MSLFASLYYYIGFPGINIKDFHVDSVALELWNSIEIRWYGVLIVCGIIAACAYTYLHARRHYLVLDDLLDVAIAAVVSGVIGARFYYVVFDYIANPQNYSSFIDFIAIWEGGLAIYGGLIFGILGVIAALKIKKIRLLPFFDCGMPGVLLAQGIGRWGNFFNMEAYGAETDIFCRMKLSSESGLITTEVHPTFLYESLWNLLGCLILSLIFKKKKFDGQIFLMTVAWYGFGRMFIEGLRQDSLWLGPFRISQLLAAIFFAVSLVALIVMFIKIKGRRVARCIYESVSAKYVPYECEDDGDPDYDYDIDMLYIKKSKNKDEITSENDKQISEAPENASASENTEDKESSEESKEAEEILVPAEDTAEISDTETAEEIPASEIGSLEKKIDELFNISSKNTENTETKDKEDQEKGE